MLWLIHPAVAATLNVPGDYDTIGQAVAAADAGDTIVIAGEYAESVVADKDLTFEADAARGGATWSPGAAEPLQVAADASVTVRGIVFDALEETRSLLLTDRASLTVQRCTLQNGRSLAPGGAILAVGDVALTVTGSTLSNNQAERGGHIHYGLGTVLEIDGNRFVGGVATLSGGALSVDTMPSGTLRVRNNWFEGNDANGSGGAVALAGVNSGNVFGNLFCANVAAGAGGALDVVNTLAFASGNVFVDNVALGNGGAMHGQGGDLSTLNNHFVANLTQAEGAAIYTSAAGNHVNDLFAHNATLKKGLAAFYDGGGLSIIDYALYFDNTPNDATLVAPHAVRADPRFTQWPADPCMVEHLVPASGSPAIDAGDPSQLDYDGTRSDIGAFGGLKPYPLDLDQDGATIPADCDDADPAVRPGAAEACNGADDDCDGVVPAAEQDVDADGTATCDGDCDDSDPMAFPGAPEVAGDGVDQDCDTFDRCFVDADGDGHGIATEVPGTTLRCDGPGEAPAADDCDDASAAIAPSSIEIACNDVDDDCDPATVDCPDGRARGAGCGCTSGPAPLSFVAWLLIGLVVRRRR